MCQVWGSALTELKTEENKNGYACRYTGPTLLAEQKTCFKKTKIMIPEGIDINVSVFSSELP